MSKRILVISHCWPPDPGGMGLAISRLVRSLSRQLPIDVLALRIGKEADLRISEQDAGLLIEVLAPGLPVACMTAMSVLKQRFEASLIHAVYPSISGTLAAVAGRYFGVPVLLSARGNDLDRDPFHPHLQSGLFHALAHADMVVGVSRDLCRMAEALGVQRTRWIPNGVDADYFRPGLPDPALRARLNLDGAGPVFGFTGEARHKKGLMQMLDAFEMLLAEHSDARLLLIGGVRDEDRPHFDRRLAANPALQAAVRPLDWVEQAELPAYYRLLDCFWHPALADGLPNALLEAMACGLPVAASAVGGAPDVLAGSPQEAGLIPALDPCALVRRTNALLALSSAERKDLGADSRRWIQRQFSPEREHEAYLDVYRELAGISV